MKKMDNVKGQTAQSQQEFELDRLRAVLGETEKSYDSLCDLYNNQFE
jgi:hypothetical protein